MSTSTATRDDSPHVIALVGEARGEFLFLRQVAAHMREQLGADRVLHIEMDPHDVGPDEREGVFFPRETPEFARALVLTEAELAVKVAEAEERFAIPNLRRLWLGDLQFWRDNVPESVLARQAVGYLDAFATLQLRHPGLRSAYAEDGTRLIKRAFRAVVRAEGGRFVVALPFAIPGRVVFVDHEHLDEIATPWEGFEPTGEEMRAARQLIAAVRSSEMQYAEPRDLSFTARRVRNFARMTWGAYRGRGPGERNPELLRYAATDYVRQRLRLVAMRRAASSALPAARSIYFPFHYAEDSQVTIRGEAYRNQLALVEHIAASAPYGYELWLKPHPAYAGSIPLNKIRDLQQRFPQIRLLHPSIHAHPVLRAISALVTINSTTGFEALMFGVPTVTFGQSLYRGRGLTFDVTDPNELSFVLARAVRAQPPDESEVARLLAYLERISAPVAPMGYDLTPENARAYAGALAREFRLEA